VLLIILVVIRVSVRGDEGKKGYNIRVYMA
jgi:hypothetical protein